MSRRFPAIESPGANRARLWRAFSTYSRSLSSRRVLCRRLLLIATGLFLLLPPALSQTEHGKTEDGRRKTEENTLHTPQSTIHNPEHPTPNAPTPNTPTPERLPPNIKAVSAILIDAESGQVLYEKNADQPRPMASTTKIMTALLFCEHVPDETTLITASKLASQTRESSLHLKPNEKVVAHDLLRAILMRSANDACVAAAEHVGGSVPKFADLMNRRAQQLGCTHTHFMNPHGLQDKQHYTSARDLAVIARQAMQEPRITEVTRTRVCRIKRSMDKLDVTMHNHSLKFLQKYAGADGIKTGWTIPAGHCFVGSATRSHWRLIVVLLKSPDFVHETCALLDYGFARFEPRILAKAGDPQGVCHVENGTVGDVPVAVKNTVQVVVPKGAVLAPDAFQTHVTLRPQTAPVALGAEVGTLEAQRDGRTIGSSPLIATQAVAFVPKPAILARGGGGRKTILWLTSIFVIGVVSLRYGKGIAASTKSARRRWRRLTKSMRNAHR